MMEPEIEDVARRLEYLNMYEEEKSKKYFCKKCGTYDDDYQEELADHEASVKHKCNEVFYILRQKKNPITGNRDGVSVSCSVKSSLQDLADCTLPYIMISVKPGEVVQFNFCLKNVTKSKKFFVIDVNLMVDDEKFTINNHGVNDYPLLPGETLKVPVFVKFASRKIGVWEMPICIRFCNELKQKIPVLRRMMVYVEEMYEDHSKNDTPFKNDQFRADDFHGSRKGEDFASIPQETKKVFSKMYNPKLEIPEEPYNEMLANFDEGATRDNYVKFFTNLLWLEEFNVKIQLRRYNMSHVRLNTAFGYGSNNAYRLNVPGLAEKRPSLLKGDTVYIFTHGGEKVLGYAATINAVEESDIVFRLEQRNEMREFARFYAPDKFYDVKFTLNRTPYVRMHKSIKNISKDQIPRLFPQMNTRISPPVELNFINESIKSNPAQRTAVERIASGSSGLAPYIIFGPPGTGKTVTAVEAILQVVIRDASSQVWVCTDSNMAADHIACCIIKFADQLSIENLLKRVNSKHREWESFPKQLKEFSNGHSKETHVSVVLKDLKNYRIIVSTLSHSYLYSELNKPKGDHLKVSHLFVDEASQALETANLIPITGLLKKNGQLVLVGDPKQLGPVCISKKAGEIGLDCSLMERLIKKYPDMYNEKKGDVNYISMLVNNYRSHGDILVLPNKLFYHDKLQVHSPVDPLSAVNILPEQRGPGRAVVFHALVSEEERTGKTPSFFNRKEITLVMKYIDALIHTHQVKPEDIGVVTPYKRQMVMIKRLLIQMMWDKIEVGTVEAFQGKEKRVIIISTVRAQTKNIVHDAKYNLGFLVDDKRFNVAITRAKAKVIIIGNAECLKRDKKWRAYMELCAGYSTYFDKAEPVRTKDCLKRLYDKCESFELIEALKLEKLKTQANRK